MLRAFIDACARGRLPFEECGPVYEMAGIAVLLLGAAICLAVLLKRRGRQPPPA